MANATVKMSLHLPPEANALLEEMSEMGHTSKSDVLRKSIALMKVALESKQQGNHLVVMNNKNEPVKEIVGI